jgi:hypothetical protein
MVRCGIVRRLHHTGSIMANTKKDSSPGKRAGGMTKKNAVEKGLKTLGNSATPTQLQKHIREHYKIEMDLKHISTAKNKIMKAAGVRKQASLKTPATKPPAHQETAARTVPRTPGPRRATALQARETSGISLKDIETVKDLVERVGATSLKKLIDVMAR